MTTYADMYTRIGDEIQDSSLTAQVQRAIQDAIALYEPNRFYFNQTIASFSTVASQEYYGAADFADIPLLIEINSLIGTIGGSKFALQAEDFRQLDRVQNGLWLGPPRSFAYYNQQIRLFPIPDQAYPMTMAYHHRLTPLVGAADTNAWMVDGEMLIRQTAKAMLALDVLQEPAIAQGAQILADKALARLQMETRKRRSNIYLKTDVPVGSHADQLSISSTGGAPIMPPKGLVITDVTAAGGTVALTAAGWTYIHNSTAPLMLTPPAPFEGLEISLFDADGTAGSLPISWAGTIAGITNPVLLDVAFASVVLQYHAGNWVRLR